MTVTISYYIKMVDDGYAEVDTTYRKDSNKSWNGWHGEKLDLKKKNKQTITHTYSIGCKDMMLYATDLMQVVHFLINMI